MNKKHITKNIVAIALAVASIIISGYLVVTGKISFDDFSAITLDQAEIIDTNINEY